MTERPLILLLEDEAIIAIGIEADLSQAGFTVHTCYSCQEAGAWLIEHTPQLAILDVNLADGSSADIAQKMVDLGVPFVVYTGQPQADFRASVFDRGSWLEKPCLPDDLISRVRELTGPEQAA